MTDTQWARLVVTPELGTWGTKLNPTIFCPIHVATSAGDFPSDDWTDFAVIVLSWWIPALASFRNGGASAELLFMDGPYSVELRRGDDDMVTARLCRNFTAQQTIGHLDVDGFSHSVISGANHLVRHAREGRREVRALADLTAALQQWTVKP